MSENLKRFLEAVSKDENLREKAKAFVKNADKEQAIAAAINLAKQLGIELAEADFEAPKEEISEEEILPEKEPEEIDLSENSEEKEEEALQL